MRPGSFTRQVSSVLRIAVSGYYGFKNAGDDAILMALVTTLRALAPGVEITVFSNSPAETRQLYGVRAVNRWNPFRVIWALLHSDLLLSGGGGLLQDVTGGGVRSICYYLMVVLLALVVGKPVVYYAQGVGPDLDPLWTLVDPGHFQPGRPDHRQRPGLQRGFTGHGRKPATPGGHR